MAKFIGCYKAKVDDKGRLIFPSAFKSSMGEGASRRFVVKKSLFAECLEMYAYDEWEKDSEAVRSRLNFFNPEHAAFWREYMRGTADVEPDSKLGRMMIPKALLEKAGIDKEVVFAGNNHLIEIWDKEKYEAKEMGSEEFVTLAQKILG
ncbi:MAG: division/cell wall cluster transcriptional repressor MraZ [Bacteroidales bacterium]|nr:division/cell wall cluster transcriptional repressor MraZ [Bacteroidales bacterium]